MRRVRLAVLILSLAAWLLTGCSHPPAQAAGPRMIVLGIDGMDPVFLETHWQSLPNLNRLRTEGDFRRLGTTIPPQSPVAWSTVTTGMDPGGHGIFDFIHVDQARMAPYSSMAQAYPGGRSIDIA